jgi:hypothetical protein
MALNLTSFDAALKQHYTSDAVENLVYQDNPAMALMPKMEDFGGRNLPIPLIYGNPQGRSAGFSTAQSIGAAGATSLAAFLLTRVTDYSVATIDNQTLEASKGNANAFMEAATTEIDGAINNLSRSLSIDMYRAGWGDRGVIGSISSSVITLATVDDVTNFEVGMNVVFSSSQNAAALRASGAAVAVTAVDRSAGTVTIASTPSGVVANDFIFAQGDRQDSATPTALKMSGFESWVPASSPTSTTFFGVNRAVDVTRLGGQRYNSAGVPIEEALIEGAAVVAREGGKLDHYFMNFAKYSALEKSLGSKVQYVDLQANAQIAFRGIQINGPKGVIKIVPDQNCPSARYFGLQLNTWKLYSLGKAVRVIDTDGLQMLRQSSADGVEVRYGFYGNVGCRGPGYSINIQA